MPTAYAHTLPNTTKDLWEPLPDHLARVAELAGGFAAAFGAKDWGETLGRWHDLGKYSQAFQDYISGGDPDAGEETAPGGKRVDHSTYGARHAYAALQKIPGHLIAFCIAGHHAGLTDARPDGSNGHKSTLEYRLNEKSWKIPIIATLPPEALPVPALKMPIKLIDYKTAGFSLSFLTRMLFSTLIDADRTATEEFCNPDRAKERSQSKPTLADLRNAFDTFIENKTRDAAPTPVNAVRASVLVECLNAAAKRPGFFSLNVPTGGGKTFASLAFALRHAAAHPSIRRVVVAIPFTSIIEQTADQYRRVFGPLAMIEHHSNLDPKNDTRENQMAAENWDAPLVVTTNVQLFESLFAAGTTPARKLHRLANSVIVLDEAQTLPVELLRPTLAALNELVTHYGCTVVLCTATQPALEYRPKDFEIGFRDVEPIIADAPALHATLRRVTVERIGKISDDDLADRLAGHPAVLCVVNTKAHAAKLYDAVVARRGKAAGCYHLSTMMCAQNRRDVLAEIRQRLKDKKSCRVISTQLIEAGVDVSFPVVYRATAGFDSIAQAAGRCNREGELKDEDGQPALGRVYVFESDAPPPPGLLRTAAQVATNLAADHPDPLRPDAVEAYFRSMYWSQQGEHHWDKPGVMDCFRFESTKEDAKLAPFRFKTAATLYKLIEDNQTAVLVPYNDEAKAMIADLMTGRPPDYAWFRRAQRYTVSVYDHLLHKLAENMTIASNDGGLYYLTNEDAYVPEKGMLITIEGFGPDSLIR